MWKLDKKECGAQKSSWFWTVVMEKTLENPLFCKETWNQTWLSSWTESNAPDSPIDFILQDVWLSFQFQFSHWVISDSLWLHGLQHAWPSCPSPTPRVYSNSCPLSWWCHPIISSSAIPFFSHLQSSPASESFPMSHFTLCGQSIGVSASASVFQRIFRTDFLEDGLVGSPCGPRDSQEFSSTPQFKIINSLVLSFLCSPTLTLTQLLEKP